MTVCAGDSLVLYGMAGEAVNNASGFGFNGYDQNGEAKWNLITNVNIVEIEVGYTQVLFSVESSFTAVRERAGTCTNPLQLLFCCHSQMIYVMHACEGLLCKLSKYRFSHCFDVDMVHVSSSVCSSTHMAQYETFPPH